MSLTSELCITGYEKYDQPAYGGRDGLVGIATRYGIESQRVRNFPHPSRLTMGPTQPSIQRVSGVPWG